MWDTRGKDTSSCRYKDFHMFSHEDHRVSEVPAKDDKVI